MNDLEVKTFLTVDEWQEWLAKHHADSDGVWIRLFKKNSPTQGITYAEALDEALCFGWIDSQVKKFDNISYIQKFSPRKSKSMWSKLNTQHIERLILEKRMKPAGLARVEEAKKDDRWATAYHPPSTMEIPKDFLKELSKNKKAEDFFKTLNKTNTYAIAWKIQTAKKPEIRKKWIEAIITMLSNKQTFH
jgi:uncharacterized protein YdeI (YjbR/CyaY-like superfamily)